MTSVRSRSTCADRLPRRVALCAIDLYQRHVSPHKGFCCAYRVHTARRSCSALGHRAIRARGLWGGLALLRQRFRRCALAHRRYGPGVAATSRQAGFCDCACPCDVVAVDCPLGAADAMACLDCTTCDCGSWGRSRKDDDDTYLPPPAPMHAVPPRRTG